MSGACLQAKVVQFFGQTSFAVERAIVTMGVSIRTDESGSGAEELTEPLSDDSSAIPLW